MKAKKFLEQQAEQDRQAILSETDARFLQEMKVKIEANTSTPAAHRFPRLKFWLAVASGILASIVVLVCVLVFYPQTQNKVVYYENNFVKSDSTLQAMDDDMKEFAFLISDNFYTTYVEKTTDSVSGDVIMYQANVTRNDNLLKMTIIAVCNKNYNYKDIQITENFMLEKLSRYDIYYLSERKSDSDFGIEKYSAQAQIKRNTEYIYIMDYSETILDGQPRFFDIIQSLIQ